MKKIVKEDLLGVRISAATYEVVVEAVLDAAARRQALRVTALDAHGLSRAAKMPGFRDLVNSFDIVTPDGHSLRWGLNVFYDAGLPDRVAGPELTLRLCKRAAETGLAVFLYGSHEHVVRRLAESLVVKFPGLKIAGLQPSRFRPSTPEEDRKDMEDIQNSGARLVLVGLGCPLQEEWVCEHSGKLNMPLLAVGAAFDFLSGNKPRAPKWMRDSGIEWIYRIASEPKRLIKRSLPAVTYTFFALLWQYLGLRSR